MALPEARPVEISDNDYDQEEMDRLQNRRDDSKWYLVLGVGMMFAGGVSVAIAAGGALMVLYGFGAYLYWNHRMKRLYDPWKDEELEAWEEEEMQR